MKISVVVPAYNEENYIEACLKSLLNQQEKPDEIIVVNNNSTDKTIAIVKNYPVRIINESQQGMIQARNRGFNEAKYEIIARTDADTRVPPDWIKKIKEHFKNNHIVALSGMATTYDIQNKLSKQTIEKTLKSYLHLMKTTLGHDCLYGPNMAIRHSTWNKIKNKVCLNDRDVHEDIDLAIHLARYGEIKLDETLIVNTSSRRSKKLSAYFEYPYRVIKSVQKHKKYTMQARGAALMKKLLQSFPISFR